MDEKDSKVVDFPGAIRRARDVLETEPTDLEHILLTRTEAKLTFPELAPDWIDNLPVGARFIVRDRKVQLID